MGLRIWTTVFSLTLAQLASGQTGGNPKLVNTETTPSEPSASGYAVMGATPGQEALVRAQIRIMKPEVYPLRVLFVLHCKYYDTAKTFRLHVHSGSHRAMIRQFPS